MGKILRFHAFRWLTHVMFLVLFIYVFLGFFVYLPSIPKGKTVKFVAAETDRKAPMIKKATGGGGMRLYGNKHTNNSSDENNLDVVPVQRVSPSSKNSASSVGVRLLSGHLKEDRFNSAMILHQEFNKVVKESSEYKTFFQGKTRELNNSECSTRETTSPSSTHQIMSQIVELPDDEYLQNCSTIFTPRPLPTYSYSPKYLIQVRELCPTDGPYVLVVVPSVHDHTKEREFIRNTWGSPAYGVRMWPGAESMDKSVKLVFFLGVGRSWNRSAVWTESRLYGDIVMADLVDSYRNLSLKMGAVLHWSATFCPGARHLLKVDEDTVVNLPALVKLLEMLRHKAPFVLGHQHYSKKPLVVRTGMWAVGRVAYPLPYFPRYMYGHCYVISGDVVRDLLHAHRHIPLIPVEDAFLTGILAKTVGALRLHSNRFVSQLPNKSFYNRCDVFLGKDISQTGLKNTMETIWELFRSGKCFTQTRNSTGRLSTVVT